MATAKQLWDVLHKCAGFMPVDHELYREVQDTLDSGADDSILEECIESLESVANLMRGMTLDKKISPVTREVLRRRYGEIDELTERLMMGAAAKTDEQREAIRLLAQKATAVQTNNKSGNA